MADNDDDPCNICAGEVQTIMREGQMSIMDVEPPLVPTRVCLNPKCPSNIGEMTIADYV